MVKPDVLMVLLNPGINQAAPLFYVALTTLSGDMLLNPGINQAASLLYVGLTTLSGDTVYS
jgi:hypothetical protein